jgi:glycosyltransferase involved in cell wall biosynthesis
MMITTTRSRAIRVLLFVDNFEQGGTQTQLLHLANGLARDPDFHVHVGCLKRRGPLLSQLEVPSERVAEYSLNRFYSARGAWQIARLAREIARHRIGVVHALDFYANVMCAAAAAWNPKLKLVVSRRYKQLSNRRLHRIGERWSYRLADAVVMNSAHVAREVVRQGLVSQLKVTIIPNGVDLGRFTSARASVKAKGFGARRWRVGVVARLCADKGLETMLEAAAGLVPTWRALDVVLVGDGEQRSELEARVHKLGLRGHVTFTGAQADVRPWIGSFDIAVLPSRREGLPNVLLEYLAMGRSVVATRVGGIPEVLRDGSTGVLVPPDDPASLAAAIDDLLRDSERRAAMEIAAKRRARDFSVQRMVGSTCKLYRRLLSNEAEGATALARRSHHGSEGSGVRYLR